MAVRGGLWAVHVAVFLFGLAGLFGKLLPFSPMGIVAGRGVLAALALAALQGFSRASFRVRARDLAGLAGLGVVLAVHWSAFFQAIRVSTVAVGLIGYATFPVFVTFLEPWLFKERLRAVDLFTALLVCLGLLLVVPAFDIADRVVQGLLWGTLSGATFAWLSVVNRRYVRRYPASLLALYQNTVAGVILLPFLLPQMDRFNARNLGWLLFLGVVCTALAHALFIRGLARIRAQLASVIACLEPVYGILFALLLVGEVPSLRTVSGGLVIWGAALLAAWRRVP